MKKILILVIIITGVSLVWSTINLINVVTDAKKSIDSSDFSKLALADQEKINNSVQLFTILIFAFIGSVILYRFAGQTNVTIPEIIPDQGFKVPVWGIGS